MSVRIALDAMGGDQGPDVLVAGAVQAVNARDDIEITLLGDEERLKASLRAQSCTSPDRIRIVHTSQVVEMDESPFDAIRRKKDSSVAVAFKLHKQGEVEAVVSAGNSGATLAAAMRTLGRLKRISRPGIAGIFPTLKGPLVMMDVGANVDCRPQHLFQFGIMAAAFSSVLFGYQRPRIGL
ncbi:MAG: phosphate--acyl-ACP acyltransferase, partial [Desulfobulbaceae bacterium]|nr:phosphate--acyl-ACP acyltransferase [Desulfobulbaceae bacterium]